MFIIAWTGIGSERRWLGLPLARLVDAARPDPDTAFLVARAIDGWECSLPLSSVEASQGYVVLGMAGRPLSAAHGFPARLFFPGIYGQYAGAKWLTELRVQPAPNRDYWLARGWPRGPVLVRPLSRIDAPTHRSTVSAGTVDAVGVAWAPPSGVAAVQVAVDDGPWVEAELAGELAPVAWRRWRLRSTLPAGKHRIGVRCVAKDGTVQDGTPRTPFPSGVSGYHSISVRI